MKQAWTIALRELRTFFDSLIAYILLGIFLILSGVFTWVVGGDVFYRDQASMQSFFDVSYWTLFFFIPALTMGMVAEERRSGTLEVLLTRPVTDWEVVFGKFLACWMLIGISLLLTLPYYFTIVWMGPIDHGAVWCGYLGLMLLSATYISIGLFASSSSRDQIVAFLLALVIAIGFHWLFDIFNLGATGMLADVLDFLSFRSHFDSIARGVIDSRDILFFLSFTLLGLILAEVQLVRRNVIDLT